jgi:cytochrome c
MRNMLFAGLGMLCITVSANPGAAWAQDVAAGEKSFRKCLPCHSIGPAAQNKVGPEQNGLDGRQAGTVPGYTYSQANKNSGIVWNDETFKEYIVDPRAKIPGTKMIFPGIKDPKEATDLWAYIKQFDAEGNIKK